MPITQFLTTPRQVVPAVGIRDPSFITYSVREHAQPVDAGDSGKVVHWAVSLQTDRRTHGHHVIADTTTTDSINGV